MVKAKNVAAKEKRLTFEQQQKLAELEQFLFETDAHNLDGFGREAEEDAELLAVSELVRQAQASAPTEEGQLGADRDSSFLIWEDRGGDAGAAAAQSDEEEEREEVGRKASEAAALSESERGITNRGAQPGTASDEESSLTEEEDLPQVFATGKDGGASPAPESTQDAAARQEDHHAPLQAAPVERRRRPVWEDKDDEMEDVNIAGRDRLRKLRQAEDETTVTGKEYEARLRQQHSKLNPRTSWASPTAARKRRRAGYGEDASDEDEEEEGGAAELLASAGPLLAPRCAALPPGLLETSRLRDANRAEPSQAVVRSLEWHPDGHILMTAGLDKRLRFFQVDGVRNPKVQSIFLDKFPIAKAAFAGGGSHVIATARRKHFYTFDLASAAVEKVAGLVGRPERSLEAFAACPAPGNPLVAFLGNEGCVPLVSLRGRQPVGDLKMSGTVRTAAFTHDGLELLTSGSDGVVHTWDLRMQRCVSRARDEGSFCSTSLAVSRDGRFYATGSKAGVVNLYERKTSQPEAGVGRPMQASAPAPLKTLMNLTTTIDSLVFSPDTQMLAMASRMKKDALRLVHLPSGCVFQNWPTSRSPLGYVHSVAFSPGGGYLAVGNAKGRALLYRLHHYATR